MFSITGTLETMGQSLSILTVTLIMSSEGVAVILVVLPQTPAFTIAVSLMLP
ncbi:MAG: hypothetical protein IKQ60_07595 [Candidatus Methanomethylophilaceae archaeon]|nr:hypothetical protein [Candidatus Methanomethylophilaceae archaeon]